MWHRDTHALCFALPGEESVESKTMARAVLRGGHAEMDTRAEGVSTNRVPPTHPHVFFFFTHTEKALPPSTMDIAAVRKKKQKKTNIFGAPKPSQGGLLDTGLCG